MPEQKTKVRFYFDFISPYCYLGWVELKALAQEADMSISIEPVPILFADLKKHWGNTSSIDVPPKWSFVFKDVRRRAKQMGLEVQLPAVHPFNPLLSLCLIRCLQGSPRQSSVLTSIFEACWGRSLDIADPQTLAPIFQMHGFNSGNHPLFNDCATAENEAGLREATQEAIKLGVFGVPTYQVDNELFWGSDQIDFLRDYLEGKDPLLHG